MGGHCPSCFFYWYSLSALVAIDRCNGLSISFGRRFVAWWIAGPLVQLPRCRVGFSLGDVGQAGSWEVLPPQIHCVLAGSALPRMVWVAEIDGGQCKAPVCRNFLPPVSKIGRAHV